MGCGTIAGLALAAAGTGAQEYANIDTRNKMNDAVSQEIAQQNAYAKKGQGVFQNSLSQSTPQAAQQQISQGQQQAAQSIAQAQANPMSLSTPSFGNVNTMQESARRGLSNQAASNYFGQSNYPLQQYIKDLQAQGNLGVINNQAQQEARNFPVYLQQAQQSNQGLSALGSLLGTAGTLTGLASAIGSAPAANTYAGQSLIMGPTRQAWMYPEATLPGFAPVVPQTINPLILRGWDQPL